jgi:propanediol dehydratase large subunit
MKNKLIEAILKINSNAEISVTNEDINTIEWHNGTTPIPVADIEAQFPAVEFDMAMADLRARRNKDLQDSDWTQLPDNTLTSEQRNAWMQFRTELRNITNGITTVEQVNNIDYPDKP